ncbi:MAG: DinB family protein [Chloroflexia bacterium]
MDDTAANILARETALADFDHARDDFETAYALVPEEALDYKPEGDDYAISDLVPHITASLIGYSRQLDKMKEAEYRELRLVADALQADMFKAHREARADSSRRPGQRRNALDEMEAAHDALAARLRDMAHDDYYRVAPVFYPSSDEVYPTRPSDIAGWLTDHYREHVPHVQQLLDRWQKEPNA